MTPLFLFQFQFVQDHFQAALGCRKTLFLPLELVEQISLWAPETISAPSRFTLLSPCGTRWWIPGAAHLPPNSRAGLMELRVRLTTAVCGEDGEERLLMERMVTKRMVRRGWWQRGWWREDGDGEDGGHWRFSKHRFHLDGYHQPHKEKCSKRDLTKKETITQILTLFVLKNVQF